VPGARCEKECYKLSAPYPWRIDLCKPLVVRLALLLIAAAILVLGPSFNAGAGKKCITIGEKSICFDDGKNKKNNNDDDDEEKDDAEKQEQPKKRAISARTRSPAHPAMSCSTSRTNTAPAASPRKGSAPLTAQAARRQTAARKAPPSAREPAGLPIVLRGPLVRRLTASGHAGRARLS
jgi:hypothetical protein